MTRLTAEDLEIIDEVMESQGFHAATNIVGHYTSLCSDSLNGHDLDHRMGTVSNILGLAGYNIDIVIRPERLGMTPSASAPTSILISKP